MVFSDIACIETFFCSINLLIMCFVTIQPLLSFCAYLYFFVLFLSVWWIVVSLSKCKFIINFLFLMIDAEYASFVCCLLCLTAWLSWFFWLILFLHIYILRVVNSSITRRSSWLNKIESNSTWFWRMAASLVLILI